MVVLEAAAIGAASYGLYKGGDAAVKKGSEAHRDFKRESHRSSQRTELGQKTKSRNKRISQLANMRRNGGNASANLAEESSKSVITSSMKFLTSRGQQSTSTVDDRHKIVMEKLMSERKEENKKEKKKLLSSFFQRK